MKSLGKRERCGLEVEQRAVRTEEGGSEYPVVVARQVWGDHESALWTRRAPLKACRSPFAAGNASHVRLRGSTSYRTAVPY